MRLIVPRRVQRLPIKPEEILFGTCSNQEIPMTSRSIYGITKIDDSCLAGEYPLDGG